MAEINVPTVVLFEHLNELTSKLVEPVEELEVNSVIKLYL
jgi:hypothetical protein